VVGCSEHFANGANNLLMLVEINCLCQWALQNENFVPNNKRMCERYKAAKYGFIN